VPSPDLGQSQLNILSFWGLKMFQTSMGELIVFYSTMSSSSLAFVYSIFPPMSLCLFVCCWCFVTRIFLMDIYFYSGIGYWYWLFSGWIWQPRWLFTRGMFLQFVYFTAKKLEFKQRGNSESIN
jgi:hypothetical protein